MQQGICSLCGIVVEDTYHALCQCDHAQALWRSMQEEWPAMPRVRPHRACLDWVLLYVMQLYEIEQFMILVLLWCIWYVRNEITHDKEAIPIMASRMFLANLSIIY